MSSDNAKPSGPNARAQVAKAKKADALKAALRENLHKRKAQARAKKSGDTTK